MLFRLGVQCLVGSQITVAKPDKQDQIGDNAEQGNRKQILNGNPELQQDRDTEESYNGGNVHPQIHAADYTLGLAEVEHPCKGPPKNQCRDKRERQNKCESEIVKVSHIGNKIFTEFDKSRKTDNDHQIEYGKSDKVDSPFQKVINRGNSNPECARNRQRTGQVKSFTEVLKEKRLRGNCKRGQKQAHQEADSQQMTHRTGFFRLHIEHFEQTCE